MQLVLNLVKYTSKKLNLTLEIKDAIEQTSSTDEDCEKSL